MTNWKAKIEAKLKEKKDTLVYCTLTEEEANKEFDGSYDGIEGPAFTAWGRKYVYFPICYGGAECVGSAPRDPNGEVLKHQGGE